MYIMKNIDSYILDAGGSVILTSSGLDAMYIGNIIFENHSELLAFAEAYHKDKVLEMWNDISIQMPKEHKEYLTKTVDNWYRICDYNGHKFPSQVTHWKEI